MITTQACGLPDDYWDTIEKYYPNYHSCDLVAESNDLDKLLSGNTDIEDLDEFLRNHPNPQYEKTMIDVRLYIAALESALKPVLDSPTKEFTKDLPEFKMIPIEETKFAIGETVVTQELYEAVMGSNPSQIKGKDYPVTNVSWNDAQEFIRTLNSITGKEYRLPTELEGQLAAGADPSKLDEYVRFEGNSCHTLHPVATLTSNENGLFDMLGNVWEWCEDWHDSDKDAKVMLGGSWVGDSDFCRGAFHYWSAPSYSFNFTGFRLAINL